MSFAMRQQKPALCSLAVQAVLKASGVLLLNGSPSDFRKSQGGLTLGRKKRGGAEEISSKSGLLDPAAMVMVSRLRLG